MNLTHRPSVVSLLVVSFGALAAWVSCPPWHRSREGQPAHAVTPSRPAVIAAFVENSGQWPEPARFLARMSGAMLRVETGGLAIAHAGRGLRLRFRGGVASPPPVGEDLRPERTHFLLGNDPAAWRQDVRSFGAVRWRGVWPGVDVRLHGLRGVSEYDLLVAAGARVTPASCWIEVEGADSVQVRPDGSVWMACGRTGIEQEAPLAWQVGRDGERRPVCCRVRQVSALGFGFELDAVDDTLPTVIDPGLVWSSLLGGGSYEWAYAVGEDGAGSITVAGETAAADFPVTAGAFDTSYNGSGPPTSDAFVSRFDATGTRLIWSTYLGGSGGDKPYGLHVDSAGVVTVVGNAASANFPTTTGAFDTSLGGASDAFVTRLSADGSRLIWSTLLGGNGGGDIANAVAVDTSGTVTVAGVCSSSDFPTTPGAYSRTAQGTSDAFLSRLTSNGQALVYSTLVGGGSGDVAQGLVVDGAGVATMLGVTSSADFPTTAGAFQRAANGPSDSFVTRVSANGSALVWSTLLGGGSGDVGEAIALHPGGDVVVTGVTSSTDFPTTPGAFQVVARGSSDTFVTRIAGSGATLRFSTLLGGGSGDVGKGIVLNALGQPVVTGQMSSSDFPTTAGAFQNAPLGTADAFVSVLTENGTGLVYSTLVGGGRGDGAEAICLCAAGGVAIAGVAGSSDFPVTPGAPGSQLNGTGDAFVTRLSLLPAGVAIYGVSTPACQGAIDIGVNRLPQSGDAGFATTAARAPQLSAGILVIGGASFPAGLPVAGVRLFVDVLQPTLMVVGTSDAQGAASVALPLVGLPRGVRFFAQWVWLNTAACGGLGTLSASNAADILVQ
jgi:hypothetical protein